MRLNTQTDFALRMLMFLATRDGRLATIADVAERYDISRNHLMKVAHLLGQGGFIETVRGRAGGLRLAKPTHHINLGAVIRHIESDAALVECFRPDGGCLISPACRLKGILGQAKDAFFQTLDAYSLADLTRNNEALESLLAEEAA